MYGPKKNIIMEKSGFTIQNPEYETMNACIVKVNRSDLTSLDCGNYADQLCEAITTIADTYTYLDEDNIKQHYTVFIIDFDNVENVGDAFFNKYIMYYLTTKFKLININMSALVQTAWSNIVLNFFDTIILEDEVNTYSYIDEVPIDSWLRKNS